MPKKKEGESRRFEDALGELEQIVRSMEEGTLGLEDSLQKFEQGIALLRHCYGVLDAAERRIALLTGFDSEGNPVLQPFDATATAEQGAAARRKSRPPEPAENGCGEPHDVPPSERGLF